MCAGWKRQFKVPRDTATRNAHSRFNCFSFLLLFPNLFFVFLFWFHHWKSKTKSKNNFARCVCVCERREEQVEITLSGTRRTAFSFALLRSAETAGACAYFFLLVLLLLWRRWRNNCNVNPTAWNGEKKANNKIKKGGAAAPIELEMIFVQLFQGISDDRQKQKQKHQTQTEEEEKNNTKRWEREKNSWARRVVVVGRYTQTI